MSKRKSTIWKYNISVGKNDLKIPEGYKFLTAQVQDGTICIWALVDPEASPVDSWVYVVGTGWDVTHEKSLRYISTVQIGSLVWHIFE